MAKQYEEPRHIQFSLKRLFLLVAVIAVVIWLAGNLVVSVWSGRFELTLHIQSQSSQTIKTISYAAYSKREYAETVSKDFSEVYDLEFKPVIEVDGKALALIPCGGRMNQFGHEISYHVHRHVVLRVQYADGREHRTVLEVPHGRGPRSVTVTVP